MRLLFLTFVFISQINLYSQSLKNKDTILFTVPRGKNADYIAKKLKEKELISSEIYFKILAKIFQLDKKIKSGVYELNQNMNTIEILNHLISGKVKLIQFTIIEGWSNYQIGEYFTQLGYTKEPEEFIKVTKNKEILDKYKIAGPTSEGFLFPETYTIDPQLLVSQIHEIMIQMFFSKLKTITSLETIEPKKLYEKVIIASIIEREAIHKDELPLMASVYYNRIQKKIKLQADPTIQYILKNPKKKLTLKDLEINSPYNTYKYKGLPPTPISNPGIHALKASFFPEKTDYYYFVLMPDGRHYFSKTYQEHLEAKKRYWDTIK
ncbi:MAG: endolytic transglycosylase MltG [Leptonema sp. (in: bacteria)]